jgi:hemoglobin-like flavoprotein
MWDVFISYAHSDAKSAATSAKEALEHQNLNVWMDDALRGGERFRGAINEALEQARCVVVLWSRGATKSAFVEGESAQAARRGTLLPFLLEEGIEDSVPLEQQGISGVPLYFDGEAFSAVQLEKLVAEVKRKLSEPRPTGLAEVVRDLRQKLQEKLKDRYTLVNELGHGHSSVVFRACSAQNPGTEFAIKVTTMHMLLLTDGLYDSFVRASETAGRLRHLNIVNVHNVERKDDLFLSVTRLVDGQSLESVLEGPRPLSPPIVRSILSQVAEALAYAHKQGVLHLALRPAKIIIDREGTAHVTEFGTAHVRARHEAERYADRLLGVPTYMSPEQCRGEDPLSASSDQYSLGVIAYEMLTGRPPFKGNSPLEIMRQHCDNDPPPLEALSSEHPKFAAVVLKMLAKSPKQRYQSMRLLKYELDHALSPGTSSVLTAYDSYCRCCAQGPFADLFYANFIAKPGVSEAFAAVQMDRQAEVLEHALKIIFTSGLDSDAGRETFSRIARKHSRIDLSGLYEVFVDTIVDTVRQQDPECTPEVEQAWTKMLGEFIERLKAVEAGVPRQLPTQQ